MSRRSVRFLAGALVCTGLASIVAFALASSTGIGRALEYRSVDARFAQRGPIRASSGVVVVGIDNSTDASLHTRFPYPRSMYATAISRLSAAGAAAIVLDIQMLEPDSAGMQHDQALISAAAASGKVILATAPESARIVSGADTASSRSLQSLPLPLRGVRIPGVADPLAASGAVPANAHVAQTPDGVMRWITPVTSRHSAPGESQQDITSIAVAAIAMRDGRSGYEDAYRSLPSPMMINYRGASSLSGAHTGFRYRNFAEVAEPDSSPDLSWAAGKIVLIGAVSPVLQDLHETPFGPRMPGVEIHAHAIDTIDNRDWITRQSSRAAAVTALVLCMVIWCAIGMASLPIGLGCSIAVIGGYLWYAQHAFAAHHSAVLVVPVLSSACLAAGTMFVLRAASVVADRRRITQLFSRYVAGDVVAELLDMRDSISVGGERRNVTILFSDIRGFTAHAEHADPEHLVEQLNCYFEEMLEAIEVQRGTFDKFIGDGLMAMFGAPLHMDDHVERACAAALDMVARLEQVNRERSAQGLPPLDIGIGIHTGEAVVGNIGSPARRVEYTAIGDTVNIASRLESSTKQFGVRILVSKDVAQRASSHSYVPLGSVMLTGRTGAVEVCELQPVNELAPVSVEPEQAA